MKIAIIGLGYVGLPLALEFAKKYQVVGFDINLNRIDELRNGIDRTNESTSVEIQKVLNKDSSDIGLFLTNNLDFIKDSHIYIVTVPTPITIAGAAFISSWELMNLFTFNPLLGHITTFGGL